jgi:hypothetical protein
MSENLTKLSDMIKQDVRRLENIAIVTMKDKIDRIVTFRTDEFDRINHRLE